MTINSMTSVNIHLRDLKNVSSTYFLISYFLRAKVFEDIINIMFS